MKPESDRQICERLSGELGFQVTRGMLRYWRKRSFNLSDVTVLRHNLRNLQKSRPGFKATTAPSDKAHNTAAMPVRIYTEDEISDEIHKLENALINAPDYEVARTISVKLAGLRAAARLRSEMELFVSRESVERDRAVVEKVFRAVVLKMAAELPGMVIDVNYPEAVKRCENYAYAILVRVSTPETYE
jgi:hypothetical protein